MEEKAIVPFADMQSMASVMAKTGMFGKTPEQLLALMLIAQAEGKHPAIAAQEYDVIKGKPALNSRAALSRFQLAGGSVKWVERSNTRVTAIFKHAQGGELEVTWDIDRAKLAGLYDRVNSDGSANMYHKFPAQMLSARVIAEGVRAVFPACLSGIYTQEEVEDMEEPFDGMQNVRDHTGKYAPALDPGEPAKRGDGIATEMLAMKTEFMGILDSKYENVYVLTAEETQDANAEYHPGGRNLTNSATDRDYLKALVEKWKTRRDDIIKARAELDKQADEGFNLALDKAD